MQKHHHGLHVIGELYECELEDFVPDRESLKELEAYVSGQIKKSGLRELGAFYHYFGPGGVTAIVCIEESHMAFHTWPEDKYVTMDVYVCRYNKDKTQAAEDLFDHFAKHVFKAARINRKLFER